MKTIFSLTFDGNRWLFLPLILPLLNLLTLHHRFLREWKLFLIPPLPFWGQHIYEGVTIFLHSCSKTISHTYNSYDYILLVFLPTSYNEDTFCSDIASSSPRWFSYHHKHLYVLKFDNSSRISSCILCTDPQCCCVLWRWWLLSHNFHRDREPNLHCFRRSS